ncbi:DUF1707 domain-containing protein [Sphaerisporangium sp. B11E5]|uniref:DUF1707 SHOCT-like domain-containing protein n=1 Tax=Sphaerisporangium sp. B11E5 TaxID=3153563 RepID=UPI00325DE9C3
MTPRDDDLRIGDTERDEVMTALREHFAQGRLTHDELDERLGTALAARTAGELRRVLADLPATAVPPPAHDGGPSHRHGRGPFAPPPAPPHADLATWGYHLAGRLGRDHDVEHHEWHRHPRAPRPPRPPRPPWPPHRHHGRPPVLLFLAGALLLAGLATGWAWPVFGLVKVLFVAWLVIALLRFAHRRHQRPTPHHHYPRPRRDH